MLDSGSIHPMKYLRIVFAVFINAYSHCDVGILVDWVRVVLEEMDLSCEVVDTLYWSNEGSISRVKHPHCKLSRLLMNKVLQICLAVFP